MTVGLFAFEDCLLKHFIRTQLWLPRCKAQLNAIRRSNKGKRAPRRLKYFTFCAVGALDVLLLDREKVIRRSKNGEFDTVFFFDRSNDLVVETHKRIPGATGFPGEFVEVVVEAATASLEGSPLDPISNQENRRDVREKQLRRAKAQDLVKAFPFDVINLDVEQFIFRPTEDLPGKLTNAIRNIFEWQKKSGFDSEERAYSLNEFCLMFTTQVGPVGLSEPYINYLRDDCIQRNLDSFADLIQPFKNRSKGRSAQEFFEQNFDDAFKLAVPKSLVELALEKGWCIDGDKGIDVLQFKRKFKGGDYTILHMAMTVHRQDPPQDKRAPGQKISSSDASKTHDAVKRLFETDVIVVDDLVVGELEKFLADDLRRLFEHRRKIHRD